MKPIEVRHGDLFDVLATLPADSVDAVVTDPPYGIGFMGREWDTFKPGAESKRVIPNKLEASDNPNLRGRKRAPASSPSGVEYDYTIRGLKEFQAWSERWAREVFRVMKPGAYIVVFAAPRSYHRMACGLEDAGFVIRDKLSWIFGSGFPKSLNLGDGKGTALKPGQEPIALAWKPFKGSITACHAAHGTAALNIDAARVGRGGHLRWSAGRGIGYHGGSENDYNAVALRSDVGRWPANLAMDEDAAEELDAQSDGGSRFFYCAKPSRKERDSGCWELPPRTAGEATDRAEGSAGLSSPRAGAGRTGGARNTHPTVKPVDLMRWLVRLVAPPRGLVLDPFNGSGTTGIACALEGRRYLGIEREAEFVEFSLRRIGAAVPLLVAAEAAEEPTDPRVLGAFGPWRYRVGDRVPVYGTVAAQRVESERGVVEAFYHLVDDDGAVALIPREVVDALELGDEVPA